MPYRATDHAADALRHACACAAAHGRDDAVVAGAVAHAHADGFTLPGAEKHFPPDLALEPIHLALDARVDVVGETLAGTATTTVRSHHDGASELTLNAVDLADVRVGDADGHALTWTYDGAAIKVRWTGGVPRGETRRVAVGYRVASPIAGMFFSHPTAALPDAPTFVVTDHETERARYWLPCVDQPNARTRLDIRITADARFTILANGGLVDETMNVDANGVSDGTKSAHWRLDFPCPSYLLCFAVGDFVRCDDGEVDGVPIAYFTTAPATADDLRRSFGRTGAMLRWLNGRLGTPYPFPKYYQIALPGIGGAMENISLVTWDGRYALDETLALELTRNVDDINVHEMAHAWFGDAIVCRDYAHAWLKESWATYMEQVWFDDVAGPDEARYQFWRDAQAYIDEADNRYMRPIVTREFNSSWQMYDRHLYPGGACRLHTLRRELGDALFWEGVQSYVRNHFGGVVETDDFRRSLESVSGRSLGRFFDQWIYSPGYPDLKVTFSHDADKGEGTFTIEQLQVQGAKGSGNGAGSGGHGGKGGASPSAGDGGAAIPTFTLSTAVGWTIDGVHHRAPVTITDARHTVVVPMAKAPSIVRFDPDCQDPAQAALTPGDALLRAQPDRRAGRHRPHPGRPRAVRVRQARANIEAVAAAYGAEPFWGVRIEWAGALGRGRLGCRCPRAGDHRRRRGGSARDLVRPERRGRLSRCPTGRRPIAARLAAGLPHLAAAAAYRALGAQREAAPIDVLLAAGAAAASAAPARPGRRALRPGDDAPGRRFRPLLGRHATGATPEDARFYAPSALAELGRRPRDSRERARVVERLEDLLRDPSDRVQSAAARGLAMLGTGAAAIERYKKAQPAQDHFAIDRLLSQARGGGDDKAAALAKQLDGLRDDVRKVRDSVETLEAKASPAAETSAGGAKKGKGKGKGRGKGKVKGSGKGTGGDGDAHADLPTDGDADKAKGKGKAKAKKGGKPGKTGHVADRDDNDVPAAGAAADKPAAKKRSGTSTHPSTDVAPSPGTAEPQLRPDEPAERAGPAEALIPPPPHDPSPADHPAADDDAAADLGRS
ncbi:MAG: M1 family metallopeptidase [Anaerolineae bacterium]